MGNSSSGLRGDVATTNTIPDSDLDWRTLKLNMLSSPEHRERSHNLEKLKVQLEKHRTSSSNKERVVLLSTGAYSPVHRMHIHVFETAKAMLEKEHNFEVVAGFISPSHDLYLASKLGVRAIRASHRLEMLKIATADSEWLAADAWECTLPTFLSFESVTAEFGNYLKEKFPNENLKVMYLCGADLIVRCGYFTKLGNHGVVAVGRPGYSELIRKRLLADGEPSTPLYFVSEDTEDISSTKIRERMEKGEPIDDLTFGGVAAYIQEHRDELHINPKELRDDDSDD